MKKTIISHRPLGLAIAATVIVSASGSASGQEVSDDTAQLEARTSRLQRYLGRAPIPVFGERLACGVIRDVADNCQPIYWCRSLVSGTSGNAFNQDAEIVWLSRRSSLAKQAAYLAGNAYTTDGTPGDYSAWRMLESREVHHILAQNTNSGMAGYATFHGLPAPEPEVTEACHVVEVDSCSGRIGYVCEGFEFTELYGPVPEDRRYAFEVEFDPLRTEYILLGGLAGQPVACPLD